MKRGKTSADPRCWWCHEPTQETPYRGEAPDVIIPPSGVFVCTPACPARPEGVHVWKQKEWGLAA